MSTTHGGHSGASTSGDETQVHPRVTPTGDADTGAGGAGDAAEGGATRSASSAAAAMRDGAMARTAQGRDLAARKARALRGATGCGQAGQGNTTGEDGRTQLTMWTHSAGNAAELEVYEQIISDFNASQDDYEVVHESFPQGAYNDAIVAAAASGDLPCLLDLDGPIMPNWAWAGYLQPLGLPTALTDTLLPTAVGEWDGQIYSAGYWDAALAIFARESVLDSNGIRIPTAEQPWNESEFDAALATLQDA